MNGVFFEHGRGQGVNRVLGLGQVLLGLCSTNGQGASPRLPLRLAPSIIPDKPAVSQSKPCRHLVCQNPHSNCSQKALGPSPRNQFGKGVKHRRKGDPNPNAPQHLRGRMVTKGIPWSEWNQTMRTVNFHGRVITREGQDPPGIGHSTGPRDQTEHHNQPQE